MSSRVEFGLFQSTLPVWGATSYQLHCLSGVEFQSTLPVWGATSPPWERESARVFQSTLPVWGATVDEPVLSGPDIISIHAPRVGSDGLRRRRQRLRRFQSTLPVWGATSTDRNNDASHYISIHAPRVGSDRNIFYYSEPKTISCELRSQHDQLSGHLRIENTRLFSQNRCEPATFP